MQGSAATRSTRPIGQSISTISAYCSSLYGDGVSTCQRDSIRRPLAQGSTLVKRALVVAALSLLTETSAAEPLDLRALPADMMACKPVALRLCDRSQGYTAAALRKCGATLAARVQEVGQGCTDVLKRYGQL
jgi:hypothetical protein